MTTDERLEDLLLRWEELADAGQGVSAEELCRDCPELTDELRRRIDALRGMNWLAKWQAEWETVTGHRVLNSDAPISLTPGREPVPGYRLVERVGRGGFGEVWKAATADGQFVALKFLPWAGGAAAVELRSLEFIRNLRHPNLLTIYGSWQTDQLLVLAMELAELTLLDRCHQEREKGTPGIPHDELLGYLRDAAEGIDFLHGLGVQHRDIKPQNLLLLGGRLKVADFGLARVLAHSVTGHTGSLTVAYAAPEFFDGKTSRHSDQYSLAVTYCQLRGGRLPFEGTPAQMVAGHLIRTPDLTRLPEGERHAVARALAKNPEKRWPSCREFVEAVVAGGAPKVQATNAAQSRWSRRRAMLLGVSVLLLVTGLLVWRFQKEGEPSPEPMPMAESDRRAVFVFDGKGRILTPVERFAPVTLEAWVRPGSPTGGRPERTFIGSDIPGRSGISVGVSYHDRRSAPLLGAQILPAPVYRDVGTNQPVPLERWSHVAVSFGATETVLFLDGKVVTRGTATGNQGGTTFVVGNAGKDNPDHYFVGAMRAVRISQGTRYSDEFTPSELSDPDDAAVVIYDADHVSGGTATDLSGKGNHGVLQGISVAPLP